MQILNELYTLRQMILENKDVDVSSGGIDHISFVKGMSKIYELEGNFEKALEKIHEVQEYQTTQNMLLPKKNRYVVQAKTLNLNQHLVKQKPFY